MPVGESGGGGLREWVPRWWRGEAVRGGRVADVLLWPAEVLFRMGVAGRNRAYDAGLLRSQASPVPVISIGNIGVGGAGKTPFAAWVARWLRKRERRPAVVLRGYGADEILVHREINPDVPVFAAPARLEAIRRAAAAGCDVAVLDDAFQHRAVRRDLDVVLIGADGWTAPARLLPRGPWRENTRALARADLVVIVRKAVPASVAAEVERALALPKSGPPVVHCRIEAAELVSVEGSGASAAGIQRPIESLRGREILAVASLADPRPFVAHLRVAGVEVELASYPDHYDFSPEEVAALARRAGRRPLVMTRKEAVKLKRWLPTGVESWMVTQQVVLESGGDLLEQALWRAVEP